MKTLFNQYQNPSLVTCCNKKGALNAQSEKLIEDAIVDHINTLSKAKRTAAAELEDQMNYYLSVAG